MSDPRWYPERAGKLEQCSVCSNCIPGRDGDALCLTPRPRRVPRIAASDDDGLALCAEW